MPINALLIFLKVAIQKVNLKDSEKNLTRLIHSDLKTENKRKIVLLDWCDLAHQQGA
jgi:hypothetical protein